MSSLTALMATLGGAVTGTNLSLVSPYSASAASASAGVKAGFKLFRDGTVDINEDGFSNYNATTDWIASADRTSTIGDSYEIKLVKDGGNSLINGDIPGETWYTLNTDLEFWVQSNFGVKDWWGTLYLREIADTSNSVSVAVDLEAERI